MAPTRIPLRHRHITTFILLLLSHQAIHPSSATARPSPIPLTAKSNGGTSSDSLPFLPPTPSPIPTPVPFTFANITTAPFLAMSSVIPPDICPAHTIHIHRILTVTEGPYRVPHSAISVNYMPCGRLPLNATVKQLWRDTYMEIVPISHLFSLQEAKKHDALSLYYRLHTNRQLTRSLFNMTKRAILGNRTRSQIFVGLERYANRTCFNRSEGTGNGSSKGMHGDEEVVIVPYNSFVFIGMLDVPTNFAPFVPYDNHVALHPFTPFHIAFAPVRNPTRARPEIACPYARLTPTPTPRAPNVRMCVAGGASVLRAGEGGGGWKSVGVGEVAVGDFVVDGGGRTSVVVGFSHRDFEARDVPFLRVDFMVDDGYSSPTYVVLSEGHLVVRARRGGRVICGEGADGRSGGLVMASELRVGDEVYGGWGMAKGDGRRVVWRVTGVRAVVADGVFNVHTASGTLLVNGVALSCYTTAVPFVMAHSMLLPVRAAVLVFVGVRRWWWWWGAEGRAHMMVERGRVFFGCVRRAVVRSVRTALSAVVMWWGRTYCKYI